MQSWRSFPFTGSDAQVRAARRATVLLLCAGLVNCGSEDRSTHDLPEAVIGQSATGSGRPAHVEPIGDASRPSVAEPARCAPRVRPADRSARATSRDIVDPAWSIDVAFETLVPPGNADALAAGRTAASDERESDGRHDRGEGLRRSSSPGRRLALRVRVKNYSFLDWQDIRVGLSDLCAGAQIRLVDNPATRAPQSIRSGRSLTMDIAIIEFPAHWSASRIAAPIAASAANWQLVMTGAPVDASESLTGFDEDGDGIRDDINHLIHASRPDSMTTDDGRRYAETVGRIARAYQKSVLADTPEAANAAIGEALQSHRCMAMRYPQLRIVGDRIRHQTSNTQARQRALTRSRSLRTTWHAVFRLGGQSC